MKKIIFFVLFSSLAIVSQPAMSTGNTGPGCGIGKMVFDGDTGTGSHIGAMLLNWLLPQSSSQTSGISGCDTTTQVNNEQQKEIFVTSNIDNLSAEMAQGEGEHLSVLAALLGVAEEDHATFFELTQTNYDKIYSSTETNADMMLSALNSEMAMNPQLATYVQ